MVRESRRQVENQAELEIYTIHFPALLDTDTESKSEVFKGFLLNKIPLC